MKMAQQNEIDLLPLNAVLAQNKQLALPRVNAKTQELECYLVDDLRTLEPQPPYQIYEPDPEKHLLIQPGILDVILVPGLAFDVEYQRLGRGKGYYDKLIQRCRKYNGNSNEFKTIGIGHLVQLSNEKLPVETHDQSMDELLLL